VSELKRSRLGWNPRVELVGVEWSPYPISVFVTFLQSGEQQSVLTNSANYYIKSYVLHLNRDILY
jgi:hypothetical protein